MNFTEEELRIELECDKLLYISGKAVSNRRPVTGASCAMVLQDASTVVKCLKEFDLQTIEAPRVFRKWFPLMSGRARDAGKLLRTMASKDAAHIEDCRERLNELDHICKKLWLRVRPALLEDHHKTASDLDVVAPNLQAAGLVKELESHVRHPQNSDILQRLAFVKEILNQMSLYMARAPPHTTQARLYTQIFWHLSEELKYDPLIMPALADALAPFSPPTDVKMVASLSPADVQAYRLMKDWHERFLKICFLGCGKDAVHLRDPSQRAKLEETYLAVTRLEAELESSYLHMISKQDKAWAPKVEQHMIWHWLGFFNVGSRLATHRGMVGIVKDYLHSLLPETTVAVFRNSRPQ